MKNLSYVFGVGAVLSLVLALIVNFFLKGTLLFRHYTFVTGAQICLLAAILFALYHLIGLKEK